MLFEPQSASSSNVAPQVPYLRVIVNARCSLACGYCHLEGDPASLEAEGLPQEAMLGLLRGGLANGVRKLKFLGGEPLLRPDLPEIIGRLRGMAPGLDLSLITGGAVPAERIDAAFKAGLDRANLSIHGWSVEDFQRKARQGRRAWERRQAVLDRLLHHGRPLKLNYVYSHIDDEPDLDSLLSWAAGKALVVNVLDDLSQLTLGPDTLLVRLRALRGPPQAQWIEPDPYSLATRRLRWADGLVVEIKHQRLGQLAPWLTCQTCTARMRCREGIDALRLTHRGELRPCMDRPDLVLPLLPIWSTHGVKAVASAWRCFVSGLRRVPLQEAA